MPRAVINSFAVLSLAFVFWAFFQASKQIPVLADGNPFGEDPYDAVGSFAIQAAAVLGLLSVARSFGFLAGGDALLARTQLSGVLAVGITMASDAIALVRHGGGALLVVLVLAMAGLAAAVGVACGRGVRRGDYRAAIAVCVVAALVLFIYPEATRSSLLGAMAAIATGIVVLFVPVRFLAIALAADDSALEARRRFPVEWLLVVLIAAGIGFGVAHAESSAEGGLRRGVILIFIGFEVAAAAFGYAVLRGPLRLTLRPNDP